LSPKKDVSIKVPTGSEVLLVSKVYCDSRFSAIAQAQLTVERQEYSFMRMRSHQMTQGSSTQFKRILILGSADSDINLVIMIPNQEG